MASILQVLVVWLLPCSVGAQVIGGVQIGEGPIQITSQRLEAEHKRQQITFLGDVVARQKEFAMYSDRLIVFFQEEGKEIDKIAVRGNVRIVQGDRRATCEEATYYHREGKMILEGNPVVREGDSRITGWRIVYYVDEEKSVVEGKEDERVTATIIPRERSKSE